MNVEAKKGVEEASDIPFGYKGHWERVNELEASGQLRKHFPAKGRRYTIRNFRYTAFGLGLLPRSTEDIRAIVEGYEYDPRTDTIRVRFWDMALLTFPNQAAEDVYWSSFEERKGINSQELTHNKDYLYWKERVASRRPKKGVFHNEDAEGLERDLDHETLRRVNPMRRISDRVVDYLKGASPFRLNLRRRNHDLIDSPSKREVRTTTAGKIDRDDPCAVNPEYAVVPHDIEELVDTVLP